MIAHSTAQRSSLPRYAGATPGLRISTETAALRDAVADRRVRRDRVHRAEPL